jgi:hypothetical protein
MRLEAMRSGSRFRRPRSCWFPDAIDDRTAASVMQGLTASQEHQYRLRDLLRSHAYANCCAPARRSFSIGSRNGSSKSGLVANIHWRTANPHAETESRKTKGKLLFVP